MSIFVIGDLHLSFSTDKPMDIFGDNWKDHYKKIKKDWIEKVKEDDLILIAGDTSWAINLEEADIDFKWIDNLPGKKIVIKGNHDYWWTTLKKMNGLYDSIKFINNNYYEYNGIGICGSRGWICPRDAEFTEHDTKIYNREVNRMETSIKKAKAAGIEEILVMMHYPPTNDKHEESKFTELFDKEKIKNVFYGHLHTELSFKAGIKGKYNETNYYLTSCDYLKFKLLKFS
jgi:predicted phosphohydrolase